MPVSFPSSPTSGQVYEFSFNSWMYTGVFWRSINASGSVTSGNLGDNLIFSGNIPSGSIGANHLASGVGGGAGLSLSSGTVTSGFIGDNAITSGNIASGQIGQYQINDFSLGLLNNTRGGNFGYFAGGGTSATSPTTRADKITYSNDTSAAQTTANLSQARYSLAGISEGLIKGYFAGGQSASGAGNILATADKLTYSTNNTNAQTSANLSQARASLGGISGERTKGYFAGGLNTSSNYTITADKLVYSTDTTAAQTSANLSQFRRGLAGISEGSQKGYFAGGDTGGAVATAEKLTYSNDTTSAQTSSDLSQARRYPSGCSGDSTKGYFAGGYTGLGIAVSTTDKIIYSTDTTASQTSANLSQARIASAGISEGLAKGYIAGGYTQPSVSVATADKLTYSSDTTAAQTTANLGQARDSLAGVSQEYTSVFGNNCVFSGNKIGRAHV